MEKERWKLLKEGIYEVSDNGRIRRINSGRILKIETMKNGYKRIGLSFYGQVKKHLVHRLVARYFIGKCPKGKEVNHKDLNKANNYWRNLEYKTHHKNMLHAFANGVIMVGNRTNHKHPAKGVNSGMAKLSELKVKQIRKLYPKKTFREIGNKFDISAATVSNIINRQTWRHI